MFPYGTRHREIPEDEEIEAIINDLKDSIDKLNAYTKDELKHEIYKTNNAIECEFRSFKADMQYFSRQHNSYINKLYQVRARADYLLEQKENISNKNLL